MVGVTGQAIIKGAVYIEGPVYCHEINTIGKVKTSQAAQSNSSGVKAASPPTPMGTMLTSDTAHTCPITVDGVVIGADAKTPIYMGYTDRARATAMIPDGMYVGEVPAASITSGGLFSSLGQVNILTGQILSLNLPALAVVGKSNITYIPTPNVTHTPIPMSLTQLQSKLKTVGDKSDIIKALGGKNEGAYLPGTGYGSDAKQENLPLRGLPKLTREKIMTLFATEPRDASLAPGVVYGDGSDADAIVGAPFKMTHMSGAQSLVESNLKLRQRWADVGSANIPSAPGHGDEGPVEES